MNESSRSAQKRKIDDDHGHPWLQEGKFYTSGMMGSVP